MNDHVSVPGAPTKSEVFTYRWLSSTRCAVSSAAASHSKPVDAFEHSTTSSRDPARTPTVRSTRALDTASGRAKSSVTKSLQPTLISVRGVADVVAWRAGPLPPGVPGILAWNDVRPVTRAK